MTDRYRYRDDPYARDERGFVERASDEVRSWFGDDDADRRRRMDEAEGSGWRERDRPGRDWRSEEWRDRDPRRDWRGREWGNRDWRSREPIGSAGEREYRWSPQRARWESTERGYGYASDIARGTAWGRPASRSYEWGSPTHRYRSEWREWRAGEANYAGRGPKGYQRSDERIREDVCDLLTDLPYVDASDIEVAVRNGEVTLAGTVRQREDKRITEDLVESVSGVRQVHNELRVNRMENIAGTEPTTVGVSGTSATGSIRK